jgi:protein gp37
MSDKSAIEWTDATWNPVTGCTEVSPGCDNCYAKTFAERWRGIPGHHFEQGFDVVLRPGRLDEPFGWRKPRRVFVNSMSDLFHDAIPDEFITEVFARMWWNPRHTFQVLTKRHGRMRSLVPRIEADLRQREADLALVGAPAPLTWPLPNVWLGVSVENQQWADIRIPALLGTPAAVRWLSCEPLLGPVELAPAGGHLVNWVVVGGESGRGARRMESGWVRSLRDQCTAEGVPFFFKQWGEWLPVVTPSGEHYERVGKKRAGRVLDGCTWNDYANTPAAELGPDEVTA